MLKDLCFEIIESCPNNCKFCSSNSSINCKNIISIEKFKEIIDYFMSIGGIEEISLSGGEPFLHPDLEKMVEYCKRNNIRTVIYTSGIVKREPLNYDNFNISSNELSIIKQYEQNPYNHLSREKIRNLKQLGLDKIVFDFQASDADNYNELMGTKNQFVHVLDSILYANFEGIESEIHYIPLKTNYRLIKDVIELAELGGVKRVSILRFVPQGRGRINKNDLMLDEEQQLEFMNILASVPKENVDIRVGIPLQDNDTHLCTAGLEKLVIRYDGIILPCPAFKDYDLEVLKKYGIANNSIYDNLENIRVVNGSRAKPLCKELLFTNKK